MNHKYAIEYKGVNGKREFANTDELIINGIPFEEKEDTVNSNKEKAEKDCCRNCIYQAYVINGDLCYCFRNASAPVICGDDEGYCGNIQYRFEERPVKTATWFKYSGSLLRCSCCGYEYTDWIECTDYCGNCGAKMTGIVGEMKWDEVKDYGQT